MDISDNEIDPVQLAKEFKEGLIFSSLHDTGGVPMQSIFLPLAFMTEKEFEGFIDLVPSFVYNERSKALPRSLNGFPVFGQMHVFPCTLMFPFADQMVLQGSWDQEMADKAKADSKKALEEHNANKG